MFKCLLATSLLQCVASTNDLFDNFKQRYNRVYTSVDEEIQRRAAFEHNLKIATQFQQLEQGTGQFGVGPHSDYTPQEFATMAGYRPPSSTHTSASLYTHSKPLLTAPIDWVKKGAVTGVKAQGICGSCWSFSATGSTEGQHFLKTGALIPLSEQELMDCDTHSIDHGCHGGAPHVAFEWIINNTKKGGICTEAQLDYTGVPDSTCPNINGTATLSNWTQISQNETLIADALSRLGPLSAGINEAGMQHYRGGLSCPIADLCDPQGLNHAVLIVGFGVEDGQEYWKIKNSWGASFGEDGYFRICKGQGACGINRAVIAALA